MTDFVRSGWQGQNLQESQASDNRNRLDACCKNIFAHQVKKPLQQPMTFTQSGWTDYGKETGVSVNSCIMFVIKTFFSHQVEEPLHRPVNPFTVTTIGKQLYEVNMGANAFSMHQDKQQPVDEQSKGPVVDKHCQKKVKHYMVEKK